MKRTSLLASLMIVLVSLPALAQQGPGGPGGQGGQGGPPGGFGGKGGPGGGPPDPAEMRLRMLDDIKQQINVSDDQWKALEPKITKVMDLRRSLGIGGPGRPPGGPGGPGGQGGQDDQADETPLDKARHDLEDALDKDNASSDDIRAKTEAYRKAMDQGRAELLKAQKDLRDGLDARSEAELTLRGLFD